MGEVSPIDRPLARVNYDFAVRWDEFAAERRTPAPLAIPPSVGAGGRHTICVARCGG